MICITNACEQHSERCPTPLTCGKYANRQHYEAMTRSLGGGTFYLPREQADEPAWAISEHTQARKPSRGWKTWTLIATAFALLAAILFWPGFYEHWPRAVSWLSSR